MKNKKDNSNLSIEDQIKKLNSKIKFLIYFSIFWSIFIIIISILLIVLLSWWEISVGFFILLPFSIWFGGVLPIQDLKKEIKRLERVKEKENNSVL